MKAHSRQPQPGSTPQAAHAPTGAQTSIKVTLVKKAKRASPPAFLAAMFQLA
jgi:hypothetical protein